MNLIQKKIGLMCLFLNHQKKVKR